MTFLFMFFKNILFLSFKEEFLVDYDRLRNGDVNQHHPETHHVTVASLTRDFSIKYKIKEDKKEVANYAGVELEYLSA